MARVKFLKATVHPDYGEVKEGEVLSVPQEYLRDYEAAGIAEECDDDLSREEPEGASQREVHAPPAGGRASVRGVGGAQGPARGGAGNGKA